MRTKLLFMCAVALVAGQTFCMEVTIEADNKNKENAQIYVKACSKVKNVKRKQAILNVLKERSNNLPEKKEDPKQLLLQKQKDTEKIVQAFTDKSARRFIKIEHAQAAAQVLNSTIEQYEGKMWAFISYLKQYIKGMKKSGAQFGPIVEALIDNVQELGIDLLPDNLNLDMIKNTAIGCMPCLRNIEVPKIKLPDFSDQLSARKYENEKIKALAHKRSVKIDSLGEINLEAALASGDIKEIAKEYGKKVIAEKEEKKFFVETAAQLDTFCDDMGIAGKAFVLELVTLFSKGDLRETNFDIAAKKFILLLAEKGAQILPTAAGDLFDYADAAVKSGCFGKCKKVKK